MHTHVHTHTNMQAERLCMIKRGGRDNGSKTYLRTQQGLVLGGLGITVNCLGYNHDIAVMWNNVPIHLRSIWGRSIMAFSTCIQVSQKRMCTFIEKTCLNTNLIQCVYIWNKQEQESACSKMRLWLCTILSTFLSVGFKNKNEWKINK